METIKATALAAEIAAQHGISRTAAFDAILAVAQDLEVAGHVYSGKLASEIKRVIAYDIEKGKLPAIVRPSI